MCCLLYSLSRYPQMRSSLCLPSCLAWCPTGHGTENGKSEQVSYLSPMCGSRGQLGETVKPWEDQG